MDEGLTAGGQYAFELNSKDVAMEGIIRSVYASRSCANPASANALHDKLQFPPQVP